MPSKETIQQVRVKADEIQSVVMRMIDLCDVALEEHDLNGEVIKRTPEQMQKIIVYFGTLKPELVSLVEELP